MVAKSIHHRSETQQFLRAPLQIPTNTGFPNMVSKWCRISSIHRTTFLHEDSGEVCGTPPDNVGRGLAARASGQVRVCSKGTQSLSAFLFDGWVSS